MLLNFTPNIFNTEEDKIDYLLYLSTTKRIITTEILHGEIEKSGAQGGVDYEKNGEKSASPIGVEHRVRPWGPSFYHGHDIAVILKAVTVVAARVVLVEVVMVHSCRWRSRRFEPRRPVGHGVFFRHGGGENSSQTFATEKKLRLEKLRQVCYCFGLMRRARKYGTKQGTIYNACIA